MCLSKERRVMWGVLSLGGLLLCLWAGLGWASDKDLGAFKAWRATQYEHPSRGTVCTMSSFPVKHHEHGRKRSKIYVSMTHWKTGQRFDQFSTTMGYPLKKGQDVVVTIGKQVFRLPYDSSHSDPREHAFSKAQDHAALVTAMKRGNTMVITGTSQRGTNTRDEYSLAGFTKAYHAISKACN